MFTGRVYLVPFPSFFTPPPPPSLSYPCVPSQGLYKAKAAEDTAAVAALVDGALAASGRPCGSVPREEVDTFCKNARRLLVSENYRYEDSISILVVLVRVMLLHLGMRAWRVGR